MWLMKRLICLLSLWAPFGVMADTTARPLPPPPARTQPTATAPQPDVAARCAGAWKTAKAEQRLSPGMTYPAFLSACAKAGGPPSHAAPARIRDVLPRESKARAAATAAPNMHLATRRAAHPPTPKQKAAYARMRICGAQWKADKANGHIKTGQTWPAYWSACNKRLKKTPR